MVSLKENLFFLLARAAGLSFPPIDENTPLPVWIAVDYFFLIDGVLAASLPLLLTFPFLFEDTVRMRPFHFA